MFEVIQNNLNIDQLELLKYAYKGKNVLVTGGASFIGSHLVDSLICLDAHVRVIDDLSSGKRENLPDREKLEFVQLDLRERESILDCFDDFDIVFHLAAIHGGRGFIETFQQDMLSNLTIDNNVYEKALQSNAKMIVSASSACAYPVDLQSSAVNLLNLKEVDGSIHDKTKCFPDGIYGWTKLIGELQLETFSNLNRFRGRAARIFTAYGERENESHAAIALIAKAGLKMDPFPIWGDGQQTRNFTYVADTVTGLLLLGSDKRNIQFDIVNLGTSEHVRVIDFVKEIFRQFEWAPKNIEFQLNKPTGVQSRASDNRKINQIFGWEPSISTDIGILRTLEWYVAQENKPHTIEELTERLLKR